jgi:hypothetical protein
LYSAWKLAFENRYKSIELGQTDLDFASENSSGFKARLEAGFHEAGKRYRPGAGEHDGLVQKQAYWSGRCPGARGAAKQRKEKVMQVDYREKVVNM